MSCDWPRTPPTTSRRRNQKPLTDDEFLAVLGREVKTRRESVEAFRGGGREDLATKEEAEIAILTEFLPQPLSEDELGVLVGEAISATGAASARDLGKVMGWLSPRTRGRADGKRVSEIVAQIARPHGSRRPRRRRPPDRLRDGARCSHASRDQATTRSRVGTPSDCSSRRRSSSSP